jgi:two-component system response regulator AtoC
MDKNIPICVIDPDAGFLEKAQTELNELGFQFVSGVPPDLPIDQMAGLNPALSLLGPNLEPKGCLKCLNILKILDLFMPVLVFRDDGFLTSGRAEVPFDGVYILNPQLGSQALLETLERASEERTGLGSRPDFPIIIGQSSMIQEVREKIRTVCDKDITVLITGETGTGKELIARSIHYHSLRSKGPLVKINCSALPDELLESEVFGFQRGAFTGAHKDKPGRIELADGGTLFVDEIGDLSLNLQVKFLQVLEDKAFSRLGDTADKMIDTRVVAATNADLGRKVREGTFRKDLYYRLNVVRIEAVPLRQRLEDIPLLIHYFLNKYCYEFKRESIEIPDHILELFYAYHWPGNVRELENILRRALVIRDWNFVSSEMQADKISRDGRKILPILPEATLASWPEEKVAAYFRNSDFSLKRLSKIYISEVEKEAIREILRRTHWNRKEAAKMLRVSYKTLLNRIADFELRP